MNKPAHPPLIETATKILNGLLASGDFTIQKTSGEFYLHPITVVNDGAVEVAVDLAMKLQSECDKRSSSEGD